MNDSRKTIRTAIAIVIVMAAVLWIGVTFVGESWSDQGRYVLTLLSLLVMIVLGAALLVAIAKGIGLLWDKLTGRRAGHAGETADPQDQTPSPPDSPQQ